MKTTSLSLLLLLIFLGVNSSAQHNKYSETYGGTLNLGLGIGGYSGYYGYIGHTLPVFHINYEFDVANNLTFAPFITFYSYRSDHYRETVMPIGVKGTYYFDHFLEADSDWDFYLAGSAGFAVVKASWDNDYSGDRTYYHNAPPFFLDLHLGAEYHVSQRLGLFLDLSSGVSTIGLSLH